MTFRTRLTIASAAAVAVAIMAASGVFFVAVRSQLRDQVDRSLVDRALALAGRPMPAPGTSSLPPLTLEPYETPVYLQLRTPTGAILVPRFSRPISIPVTANETAPEFRDRMVNGVRYRTYTVPLGNGYTLLLARPLTEIDRALRHLAWLLVGITGIGVALAVGFGAFVTRTAVAPVTRLSRAAERVTSTGDLTYRIEVPRSDDELARLARAFNEMLEALEGSVVAQRRLVADASHELRTPLTSVRTNIELLTSGKLTDPAERGRLVSDVGDQLEELSALVADLVELARDGQIVLSEQDVRLDDVVEEALERARRVWPKMGFVVTRARTVVRGDAALLIRAVSNMLDNAAKWSAEGATVEVEVRDGLVRVRDHGPGFDPGDLPRVFDRFYRAPSARTMPGSGLGLAIVHQVALAHGGRAVAANAPEGGAVVVLELPLGVPSEPPVSDADRGLGVAEP